MLVDDGVISCFLGRRDIESSVFDRYGFKEPNGSSIFVTSHEFIRWLNTLAQEGGMSQELIARWSGRKDVSQNAAYDFVNGKKLAEKLGGTIEHGELKGGIAIAADRMAPAKREDFLKIQIATAHTTARLGFASTIGALHRALRTASVGRVLGN
jgi:hypothetical protein